MKKYIYMAVAAIAALSSCSSDNDVIMEETAKQPLKFTASMEDVAKTRATFDSENKCASWEVNDYIFINTYQYSAESAGLTTTFKPSFSGYEVPEGTTTFDAYFGCDRSGSQYYIPSSSYVKEGQFKMPMYAHSEDGITDLKFKNLCGVLKVTVTDEQIATVNSIKLSSANKAVSGFFTVDANNVAVLTDADNPSSTQTINYSPVVTTNAAGKVFYLAVPAQTYQELNIALNDGNGSIKNMTTKAGRNITVERNKIYPITFNATSYAASFENQDPRNSPFTGFRTSTLTASNADVSVSLALTGDMGRNPQWNDMGDINGVRGNSKLTITVTPATGAGVTVSGIEYLYSGGNQKVTKTGPGPWQFDVPRDMEVYDGSTQLGSFYGIVVNYTK